MVEPSGSTQVGEHVNITCDEAFETNGDAWPVCQADGTYSAGATCAPVMCDPYAPPEHGTVSPTGPVQEGSAVHIKCDPGFEPETPDNVDVICDKGWGEGTRCVPILCPPYKAAEHAAASDVRKHKVGETVTVHCEDGFDPALQTETDAAQRAAGLLSGARGRSGVDVIQVSVESEEVDGVTYVHGIVCGDDRRYHPPLLCRRRVVYCPPYTPPAHGSVTPSGAVAVGDCVDVACDDGYELSPESEREACCVEGPHYDPPSAVCNPVQQCPPFPPPDHGRVAPTGITHVGDQVQISCDQGYHLCDTCSEVATCTGTTYDIGPQTCVKDAHCDPYPVPPHATVEPSGNVTEGNCVHIQCKPGYEYDDTFGGKTDPCCVMDVVAGHLVWEQGKKCTGGAAECVVSHYCSSPLPFQGPHACPKP